MKTLIKKCVKCGDINSHWENETIHNEDNCHGELVEIPVSEEEFGVMCYISTDNDFLQAMLELKSKDIIEYNSKMSLFKSQLEQKRSRLKNDNTPRCPHCHSSSIQKISGLERAGSVAMLGMFSKKINKSFKCKQCGYTW